ncbi:MAG: hypothetical protein ACRDFX_07925 [Chloroflexota bacterium]
MTRQAAVRASILLVLAVACGLMMVSPPGARAYNHVGRAAPTATATAQVPKLSGNPNVGVAKPALSGNPNVGSPHAVTAPGSSSVTGTLPSTGGAASHFAQPLGLLTLLGLVFLLAGAQMLRVFRRE